VRQFVRAAGAWVQPETANAASPHLVLNDLPPAAANLFQAMPPYDRRHALAVVRTLQAQGHTDPDLLAAALLHDDGKTGGKTGGKTVGQRGALHLWHRVAVVLCRAFWPGLLERIGQDQTENWRRPFFVQLHHAAIGAELAREVGCSPVTVELIRRHEDPPDQVDDPLLAALQAADSVN